MNLKIVNTPIKLMKDAIDVFNKAYGRGYCDVAEGKRNGFLAYHYGNYWWIHRIKTGYVVTLMEED